MSQTAGSAVPPREQACAVARRLDTSPKSNYICYVVRPGDTLAELSKRLDLRKRKIARINGIEDSSESGVPEILIIPASADPREGRPRDGQHRQPKQHPGTMPAKGEPGYGLDVLLLAVAVAAIVASLVTHRLASIRGRGCVPSETHPPRTPERDRAGGVPPRLGRPSASPARGSVHGAELVSVRLLSSIGEDVPEILMAETVIRDTGYVRLGRWLLPVSASRDQPGRQVIEPGTLLRVTRNDDKERPERWGDGKT